MTDKSNTLIILTLSVTLFLLYPVLNMAPTEQASPNPPGEVYDLQTDIDDKFPTPVHYASYILEAHNGDVLTKNVLLEFKKNKSQLLLMDLSEGLSVGTLPQQSYLFGYYDYDFTAEVLGIVSILDPIESILSMMGTTIENSSEEEIKTAVSIVMSDENFIKVRDFLSIDSTVNQRLVNGTPINYWSSPAMTFAVLADNQKLGGSGLEIGLGGGEEIKNKELLNRKFGSIMSGNQNHYTLYGIAIDVNLEAEEEGQKAGPYIMLTVIAAVLIVGLTSNSYWVGAITGIGLAMMMIWLKGISALIGLKMGLVIDLVVPISMVALGVDFVVHSIRRYKEETLKGYLPRNALKISYAGVVGALLLAMLSDSIAFLSNLSSDIEAVMHFGASAGIATISSYILLGAIAPLLIMKIDELLLQNNQFSKTLNAKWNVFRITGLVLVSIFSGLAVIIMVAINMIYGLLIILIVIIVFVLIPIYFLRKMIDKPIVASNVLIDEEIVTSETILMKVTKWLVIKSTGHANLTIFATILITVLSSYYAIQLRPSFDVKDFFDSNSEFVIGLDKFDSYMGEQGGEPGIIYIKGDLTDPTALVEISKLIETLRTIKYIAVAPSGEVTFGPNVITMLKTVMNNSDARNYITANSGVIITDNDSNGFPDTTNQIKAIYEIGLGNGIIDINNDTLISIDVMKGSIFHEINEDDLTAISFQIPGTRNQSVVTSTRELLVPIMKNMETHPSLKKVALTGSPFTRESQLNASSKTLFTALPIAIIAAIILLIFAMRSFKFAIVTVIPVGIITAWLYGIMYILGFSLNFVTAMIGAISIGVGIDYSIHMTARFREEMKKNHTRIDAITKAAKGTGVALIASAGSSIAGFTILGFAPMPMFAAYGQLTAIMIFLALMASLLVLPSLLMLITEEKS